MDLNDIIKMAGEMRNKVASLQAAAAESRVEGESGGGLVRIVMNGRHEVLEVHIDPKTMVPSEVALVEDLVRAAINQATAKANDILKDNLAGSARALGIDPSLLGNIPGL